MRCAVVQFDIAWEDKASNHARIESMLDEAGVAPGTFVLLPELADTGFSFDLDAIVDDRSDAWASDCARRRGIWLQAGSARRAPDGRGRNRASIFGPDGACRAAYDKLHPFSFGREAEHYDGGESLALARIDDATVCPQICYDLRFPEAWRLGALAGAEVFAIGANWPQARQAHWRALVVARAIENQAFVLASNRIGRDPHLSYAGGSIIMSPRGDVLAEAQDSPAVLQATLDLDDARAWRRTFPALRDIRRDLLGSIPFVPTMETDD